LWGEVGKNLIQSQKNNRELLCSPLPMTKIPKGRMMRCISIPTTPVHRTAPFRGERFTLTQYGSGFKE